MQNCKVAIAIIVPFFAAFGAGGFWLKMQVYHETPEVRFGHEYLLMLDGQTPESTKMYIFKLKQFQCVKENIVAREKV